MLSAIISSQDTSVFQIKLSDHIQLLERRIRINKKLDSEKTKVKVGINCLSYKQLPDSHIQISDSTELLERTKK